MFRPLTACALLLLAMAARAQTVATVAAASDLQFALDQIVQEYEQVTGDPVRVSYGSSGNFARQIEQGAPFDLFMSADETYIEQLASKGLTAGTGVLYAIGRIVLFSPQGSSVRVDERGVDVRAGLQDGRLKKFAIANPDHAPYGRAAREALQALQLWSAIEGRLVLGENVAQAAQFAASGSTQGGIFALSLALSPNFAGAGTYVVLPERLHAPLRQRMALVKRGGEAARGLYDYLQQPAARAVFRRYGFALPEE